MRKKYILRIILVALILGGAYYYFSQNKPTTGQIELDVPSSSTAGQIFEVPLTVTVPVAINAGEFVFRFPNDLLTVKEIKKDDSIYQLWITNSPSFSNTDGTISFAGGLPSPGFTGTGTIATVVFEAKSVGVAEITIDESQSRLLANDGLGTVVPVRFSPVRLTIK